MATVMFSVVAMEYHMASIVSDVVNLVYVMDVSEYEHAYHRMRCA